MRADLKYFEAVAELAQERRSKRRGREGEALRRIKREKISAGVAGPPTDLKKLARHLGVSEIRELSLAMKARLMFENDAIVIEINHGLSEFERRYAMAHELSHLVLEEKRLARCSILGRKVSGQAGDSYSMIEAICDLGAREILLPGEWLRERIGLQAPSFEIAQGAAREANCDVDFVVKRLIDLGLWHCRLLWGERRGKKVHVVNVFPPADETFLAWIKPLNVKDLVAGESLVAGRWFSGQIKLRIKDEEDKYHAQCMVLTDRMVLLMLIYS